MNHTDRNEKYYFACFGDSITSDQVTGIGSRIAELLGMELTGNFACGYATLSDWHEGKQNITPFSLDVPMDTNTADNVLSNQVFRCLKEVKEHPEKKPDVIYIAAGINDGNQPFNTVEDDTGKVLTQSFEELDRMSMASALRWAVETLRAAFPEALVFAATPLYTSGSGFDHMTRTAVLMKRKIIIEAAQAESVHIIDSTFESGFSEQIAAANGGIHPNEIWKEKIALYAAAKIRQFL